MEKKKKYPKRSPAGIADTGKKRVAAAVEKSRKKKEDEREARGVPAKVQDKVYGKEHIPTANEIDLTISKHPSGANTVAAAMSKKFTKVMGHDDKMNEKDYVEARKKLRAAQRKAKLNKAKKK